MDININSVKFKADSKLKDFINEKVGKLYHFFDGVIGCDVILKVENTETPENKVVEIRLFVRGYDLFAKKQSKSFEESTDLVVEALRKQLGKHKAKIRRA